MHCGAVDPAGCEIQMRPFDLYCRPGNTITFGEMMRKGQQRREIVLGYLRREPDAEDKVELNPERDETVSPGTYDMVIILAER